MRVTPKRTQPEPNPSSPYSPDAAAEAFAQDWDERNDTIAASPVMAFLDRHELAGSPNELTICGVHDVKVTLGDLRAFVRALK